MVIKMLGGKRASIRYQLRNPTARVLRGDPAITQRLIDRSKFNQKYCGIVLSFEENITDATAAAILDDFRNLLCGGLEKDALDVLVVGHTDKVHPTTKAVRPDYHITAVETDLRTGKHVTIYHHRRDHDLFYAWERMTNIKYGLSRPDDPARRRTINIAKKLGQSRKDLLAEVDAAVCVEVKAGRIADRADVVRFLEEAGFNVPRQGDNYLTIADKDGNRTRLKGLFYEREFTRQRLEADPAAAGTGGADELRTATDRVAELFARRVATFQKLYRRGGKPVSEVDAAGAGGDDAGGVAGIGLDVDGGMAHGAGGVAASPVADGNHPEPGQAGEVARRAIRPRRPARPHSGQNFYRNPKRGVNYEKRTVGINADVVAHIGRIVARSRTATAGTTAIFRAAAAAMGTAGGGLNRAGAGLAVAIGNFIGVIAAVDRAVGFCQCPLQFLAQVLIHEIQRRQSSPRPARPIMPPPRFTPPAIK
jgi:hypothetical protein